MVTRREAALAAACRALVDAYKAGEENDGSTDWADVDQAEQLAREALTIKAKPTRRRAVLRCSQGVVSLSWADRGVKVTLHDEDAAKTRIWQSSLKPGKRDRVEEWGNR